MAGKRHLFFRLKWLRIVLVLVVLVYVVGAYYNAVRVALELEPVAEKFNMMNVSCVDRLEEVNDRFVETLDCGGAYDLLLQERDQLARSHGCWNSPRWNVLKRDDGIVTSAPISVTCVVPWPF